MHASRHASNSDAVSEVVGQILIFGILSTVLILALLGFNVAREGTVEQVVEVRGESVAQRISGVVVDAALFAENAEAQDVELALFIDLPDDLEGQGYTIDLEPDEVVLVSSAATARAPLFSSGAPADVVVCDMPARIGGPLQVVVTSATPDPIDCPNHGGAARAILLQDAP